LPPLDATALRLRPPRAVAGRALCYVWVAQFATDCGAGFEEAFAERIRELRLEPELRDDERALLRGEPVDNESLRLGYDEDAAIALAWVLGLADALPEFHGDANAYQNDDDAIRLTLLERFDSVDALAAAARPRDEETIADEIDFLARYEAVYARDRPGWRIGGMGEWLGPVSPEAVSARLRALRWAIGVDER
jgi:hypothetical protein